MPFQQTIHYRTERLFDPYTHALTTVNSQHRLSHDGMLFHASGKVLDIASGGTSEFLMAVPSDIHPHIQRVLLDLEKGDVDFEMFEGATTSADGVVIPTFNVNRASTKTSAAIISGGPTVTGDGTLFLTNWAPPTGTGIGSSSGLMDATVLGEEWILKENTKYLFRITNNSGATLDLRWEFIWYESTYHDLPPNVNT